MSSEYNKTFERKQVELSCIMALKRQDGCMDCFEKIDFCVA
jgi:hypothetical protein